MAKVSLKRSYRKQGTGQVVFVYEVDGTKEEIAAVEKAQGDNHRINEDNGKPLLFYPRFEGNTRQILFSQSGKIVLGDTEATMFQTLASSERDPAMKAEYAKLAAEAKAAEIRAFLASQKTVVSEESVEAPGANM